MSKVPALLFEPSQNIYIQPMKEEFRDITDMVVKNIKPYYMISNYGRIWNKVKNKFLANNVDSKGYLYKPLATYDGTKVCRVHRLVLMTFDYFPGCENYMINHKDGNKCNPALWNLEWSSYSDNIKHAWDNDLRSYTDRNSPISHEVVTIICNLLMENKYTYKEIAKICNVSEYAVSSIHNKITYKYITDKYEFLSKKMKLTEQQIRKICDFYSTTPRNGKLKNDYCTEALNYANIDINTSTLNIAERILYKQSFKDIIKDYNY